jgi:hypothetical protein
LLFFDKSNKKHSAIDFFVFIDNITKKDFIMRRYTVKKQTCSSLNGSCRKVKGFSTFYPVGGELTAAQELKMQIIAAEQANTK